MYSIVEFKEDESVAIVRTTWITPNKTRTAWPPFKTNSEKIKKCLTVGKNPDKSWSIYAIKRIFYETDDLLEARRKCKDAEFLSEVEPDLQEKPRNTKKPQRYILSSEDNDTDDDHVPIIYPKLPENLPVIGKSPAQLTTEDNKSATTSQAASNDGTHSLSLAGDNMSFGTTSLAASNAVIARHLAKLEEGIKDLQLTQREILSRLRPVPTVQANLLMPGAPLPEGVNLPCKESQEIQAIEAWLSVDENYLLLVNHLSFVGGNKAATIIRRILEKNFSNKLAKHYNWTGKNQKEPLKAAVRCHKEAEKATDAEIITGISNWFRFTKDRDGGRDRRRIAPPSTQ